jgi:hypothetical protein
MQEGRWIPLEHFRNRQPGQQWKVYHEHELRRIVVDVGTKCTYLASFQRAKEVYHGRIPMRKAYMSMLLARLDVIKWSPIILLLRVQIEGDLLALHTWIVAYVAPAHVLRNVPTPGSTWQSKSRYKSWIDHNISPGWYQDPAILPPKAVSEGTCSDHWSSLWVSPST